MPLQQKRKRPPHTPLPPRQRRTEYIIQIPYHESQREGERADGEASSCFGADVWGEEGDASAAVSRGFAGGGGGYAVGGGTVGGGVIAESAVGVAVSRWRVVWVSGICAVLACHAQEVRDAEYHAEDKHREDTLVVHRVAVHRRAIIHR